MDQQSYAYTSIPTRTHIHFTYSMYIVLV